MLRMQPRPQVTSHHSGAASCRRAARGKPWNHRFAQALSASWQRFPASTETSRAISETTGGHDTFDLKEKSPARQRRAARSTPPTHRRSFPRPDLPQGQPGGIRILLLSATSEPAAPTVRDAVGAQLRNRQQIPDLRRLTIGGPQKPSIRTRSIGQAGRQGCRSRMCAARCDHDRDSPKGNTTAQRGDYTIYATDSCWESTDGTTSSSTMNGGPCGSAISARPCGPEDAKLAAWANGKRGVFLVASSTRANVIDYRDKIKAMLRAGIGRDSAGDQGSRSQRRTTTIRRRVEEFSAH